MFLERVPLVSEPQNQPVWLTIRRHRSCYVHRETDATARWQHTPIYRSPNAANLGGAIHSQQYPRVTQIGIHRIGKMCVPLEWFPHTLKPENLTHSLHSPRSSVAGKTEVAEQRLVQFHILYHRGDQSCGLPMANSWITQA